MAKIGRKTQKPDRRINIKLLDTGAAGGNVGKAYEGVHHGQLARVIELEAGNALACGSNGRLRELSQLATIDECLQNVLLDVEVIIVDLAHGKLDFAGKGAEFEDCKSIVGLEQWAAIEAKYQPVLGADG